jgi:mono/diheme cytochrome c family protein
MQIYQTQCGTCHGTQMNAPDRLVENNGLDATINDNELGVGGFTWLHKVPSLRNINIALTAPYMHYGRF